MQQQQQKNNSLTKLTLPILNKPYKSIMNQIQENTIRKMNYEKMHKNANSNTQNSTNNNTFQQFSNSINVVNLNNNNNANIENNINIINNNNISNNNINNYHHHNNQNNNKNESYIINSESSYYQQNNSTINNNINNYKSINDNTLLSMKSQQNIAKSLRNMTDNQFQNSYNQLNQYSSKKLNKYDVLNNTKNDINIIKENNIYTNVNQSTTLLVNNEDQLYNNTNEYLDSKTIKNFLEKKQKFQEFVKSNQIHNLVQNINFQELFYKDLYQQYEFMPDNFEQLFKKYQEYEMSNMRSIYQLVKEIKNLIIQNNDLQGQNVLVTQINQECKKKMETTNKKYDNKFNNDFNNKLEGIKDQILFENQRLKKEIEILQKIANTNDGGNIRQVFIEQIEQMKQEHALELKTMSEKLANSENLMTQQKNVYRLLKEKFNHSSQELIKTTAERNNFQMKISDFEKKFNIDDFIKFREVNLMQKEDIVLKDQLISSLRKQVNEFDEKYVKLSIKYTQLMREEPKLIVDPIQFKAQSDSINELKQKIGQDIHLTKQMYKEFKEPDKPQIIKNLNQLQQLGNRIYDDQKQQQNQINYQQFRLIKPGLMFLLEEKMKNEEEVVTSPQSESKNWEFFYKLRSIMDSKYNEIMMNNLNNDQVQCISKFPEFVFAWLGTYTLEPNNRELMLLDLRETKPDDVRISFIQELTHEKYSKLWEVKLFKDFVSEKSEIDELYFYLSIRYMIFNGPQLSINKTKFDFIHYITISSVEIFVKKILLHHSYEQVEFAIEKIRDNSKIKSKKLMVDVHFLFSVLLEFYKAEKLVKFQIIRDLFFSFSNFNSGNKFSLTFYNFKSLMEDNFKNVSEIEKVQIYRECWNIGNGNVSPEVFIAVALERNLFIKQMNVSNMFDLPIKLNIDREIDKKNPIYSVHSIIKDSYSHNNKFFQELEIKIEAMGHDQFYNDFIQNVQIISEKFQIHSSKLRDKALFQVFHRLINKVHQVYHAQSLNYITVNNYDENQIVQVLKNNLELIAQNVHHQKVQAKLQQIRNNLKLINLQKFIRKKIIKFYGNLYNLLNKYKINEPVMENKDIKQQ